MNKEEFIQWLNSLLYDIQIFKSEQKNFDCVDIKIFTKPKDKEFLDWYFGM